MEYIKANPEVICGLGMKTRFANQDNTKVEKLHIHLEDWLGSDLMECYPCFIVTKPLAKALLTSEFSGFDICRLKRTKDRYFKDNYQLKKRLPRFRWMKITGQAESDDFGIDDENSLILSARAWQWLLANFNLATAAAGEDEFVNKFFEDFMREQAEADDNDSDPEGLLKDVSDDDK